MIPGTPASAPSAPSGRDTSSAATASGDDAFALHLVHQQRQAVGQIIERRAGARSGCRLDQPARPVAPVPAVRRSGGIGGGQTVRAGLQPGLGDQPQARQQPRPAIGQRIAHLAPHPPGVQEHLDPRQSPRAARLRTAPAGPRAKSPGKIGARAAGRTAGARRPSSIAQHRFGLGDVLGPADIAPAAVDAPRRTDAPVRDHPVPEHGSARRPAPAICGQPFGSHDLRTQIDHARRPARDQPPFRPSMRNPPAPPCPRAALAGTTSRSASIRAASQAASSCASGLRPGPDRIGVQREHRPDAQQRQRLPQPAAGFQNRLALPGKRDAAPRQMAFQLLAPVMQVHHDRRRAGLVGQGKRMVDQRPRPPPRSAALAGRRSARPSGCRTRRQRASADGASLRAYPFQTVRAWARAAVPAQTARHLGQRRMRQVALQLAPDARDQGQVAGLARMHAKPREDTEDPQRPLRAQDGIGPAEGCLAGPVARDEMRGSSRPPRPAERRAAHPGTARQGHSPAAPSAPAGSPASPTRATPSAIRQPEQVFGVIVAQDQHPWPVGMARQAPRSAPRRRRAASVRSPVTPKAYQSSATPPPPPSPAADASGRPARGGLRPEGAPAPRPPRDRAHLPESGCSRDHPGEQVVAQILQQQEAVRRRPRPGSRARTGPARADACHRGRRVRSLRPARAARPSARRVSAPRHSRS